jgi:hypothetical protein
MPVGLRRGMVTGKDAAIRSAKGTNSVCTVVTNTLAGYAIELLSAKAVLTVWLGRTAQEYPVATRTEGIASTFWLILTG